MKCPLCPYRARVDKKTLSRQDHYGPRVAQLFVDHVRKRHTGVVLVELFVDHVRKTHTGVVLAESYFTRRCGLCGVTFYTASECVRHWEDAGGLAEHILEWRLK